MRELAADETAPLSGAAGGVPVPGRCCCFRLRPEWLKSAPERLCVCVVWRGERGSVPGAGAELHPGDGWAVWGAEDRC